MIDRRSIPVRRGDRCEEDLKIDPEDLDELARDIAFRARRSMYDCDKNPLYGKVKMVDDIVTFLGHQPRIVEPDGAANVSQPIRSETDAASSAAGSRR